MSSARTPSQTIGPFFGFGLPWPDGPNACEAGAPGLVRICGRVADGRGDPIPDALVETWQADGFGRLVTAGFRGFARCPTNREGRYTISTVKPGAIRVGRAGRAMEDLVHAPHVAVSVFARGLLKRVVTRIYFPDEEAANRADPVLAQVTDPRARATLIAARDDDGYRFDIRLQGGEGEGGEGEGGEVETAFFEESMTESGLFDAVLGRGGVREATSDRSWLQALLDFEAALARAEARAGLLLAEDAAAITRVCRVEGFDIAELGRQAAEAGNPVPALVRALGTAVGGRAAGHVHLGATSQDAIDTAAMLVARRALDSLLDDLGGAADAAAGLAAAHRATLMAGRTLLQQALPIPFGLLVAGWLAGLDDAAARLAVVRRERLAVQLGGAAGTLASLGDAGPRVIAYLAEELGLPAPLLPWHTVRTRVAELAGALGEAAGALGKPARDIVLLAQTEVGEVREGGAGGRAGGSSTLPQKRNPIAAVSVLASTARAPGLVATLLAAMVQEEARAAGNWHAEWWPLSDLLVAVGSAAAWLRDSLEHLEVDGARMRANLALTGGMLLAERVTTALAPALGRQAAHDLVAAACAASTAAGTPFGDVLAARAEIAAHLSREQIAALLEPEGYLGSADLFIERALEQHRDRGGRS